MPFNSRETAFRQPKVHNKIIQPETGRNMKRSKLVFCLLFCLTMVFTGLGVQKARATHYAAGDIQVTFIGNDSTDLRYLVRYFVYKVCERLDPTNPNSSMNALLSQ